MHFLANHLPDVVAAFLGMVGLAFVVWRLSFKPWVARPVLAVGWGLLATGLLLRSARVVSVVPVIAADWLRSLSFFALMLGCGGALAVALWRWIPGPKPHHSPERRNFLLATRTAILASPVVATGYGVFVQRDSFRLREIKVPVRGLAPELEGLRLVQLSDIHLSPFLSERELARTVDMANETNPHLALVTGDLITGPRDPLDACIRQVARLRAKGGVFGCMGNHEAYAQVEEYTEEQARRRGIRFLRDESEALSFQGKPLNLVGVDYQRMHSEYLPGAERHIRPGMPNILLSHNPDVFPVAARQGFDLTIAGHTHGGQITLEILNQNVSFARFFTPYVYGLYQEGDKSAFVTRGIGTVGVPARLGAPPEVALIRLCAI